MALSKVTNLGTLTESIVFDNTSKGIHLGVTSATASNLMNDYEEGSFSPTLKNEGDTNLSTTKVTLNNNARYVKVGPVVIIQMTVNISALSGDSSEALIIDNLPFTSKAYQANANGGFNVMYQANMDTFATYGIVLGSSDDMRFYSATATALPSSALQATSLLHMYGHYETAS